MSLLEEVLKARKEAEQKPPCQKCKYLFWIDKETPFCKEKDKFILPEFPPNKCELREGKEVE
jgi:transposase-like protein